MKIKYINLTFLLFALTSLMPVYAELSFSDGHFTYIAAAESDFAKVSEGGEDEHRTIQMGELIEFSLLDQVTIKNDVFKETYSNVENLNLVGKLSDLIGLDFPSAYASSSMLHLVLQEDTQKNVCEILISTAEYTQRQKNKLSIFLEHLKFEKRDNLIAIPCKVS